MNNHEKNRDFKELLLTVVADKGEMPNKHDMRILELDKDPYVMVKLHCYARAGRSTSTAVVDTGEKIETGVSLFYVHYKSNYTNLVHVATLNAINRAQDNYTLLLSRVLHDVGHP